MDIHLSPLGYSVASFPFSLASRGNRVFRSHALLHAAGLAALARRQRRWQKNRQVPLRDKIARVPCMPRLLEPMPICY